MFEIQEARLWFESSICSVVAPLPVGVPGQQCHFWNPARWKTSEQCKNSDHAKEIQDTSTVCRGKKIRHLPVVLNGHMSCPEMKTVHPRCICACPSGNTKCAHNHTKGTLQIDTQQDLFNNPIVKPKIEPVLFHGNSHLTTRRFARKILTRNRSECHWVDPSSGRDRHLLKRSSVWRGGGD